VVFIYGRAPVNRLSFYFATVHSGAGAGGSDLYEVTDRRGFSVGIDPAVQITSGSVLCPPTGSRCTSTDLIGAADKGFFAEVGIDASGNLRVVAERDNAAATSSPAPDASASPPSPTRTPDNLAPGIKAPPSSRSGGAIAAPSTTAAPTPAG
jgi:hypothetical protein